jgi:hypothetical protein
MPTPNATIAEAKAEIALFRVEGHEDIIKDRVYGALRSEISKRDASDCFGHKDEVAHAVIDAVDVARHAVEGGGHSFEIRGQKKDARETGAALAPVAAAFMRQHAGH